MMERRRSVQVPLALASSSQKGPPKRDDPGCLGHHLAFKAQFAGRSIATGPFAISIAAWVKHAAARISGATSRPTTMYSMWPLVSGCSA